jgi:hypothetical protein
MFRVTMWTAQSAYLTVLSTDENHDDDNDAKLNKYFGIFFCIYQTGNLSSHYSQSIETFLD